MRSALARLLCRTPRPLMMAALIGAAWSSHTVRLASAEASPAACVSLTAVRSDDADTYAFTASASDGGNKITGYAFNFGDRQSYAFAFAPGAIDDRNEATVVHAYPGNGIFTATASVNIRADGKTASVSSPGCRTVITIGPAALANTGAGNTLELFAIAVLAGLGCHHIWLRRRHLS